MLEDRETELVFLDINSEEEQVRTYSDLQPILLLPTVVVSLFCLNTETDHNLHNNNNKNTLITWLYYFWNQEEEGGWERWPECDCVLVVFSVTDSASLREAEALLQVLILETWEIRYTLYITIHYTFLAVQDSSIGDLVTHSHTEWVSEWVSEWDICIRKIREY